ncbi:MAG TPA: MXAN_6640 family putative metalloprotease, partial [Candidatus Nanopelagicales bacterium]|nr:MXAN_6640 family putative metalloprotease [Candidatus Nanopelagicales bacterium]
MRGALVAVCVLAAAGCGAEEEGAAGIEGPGSAPFVRPDTPGNELLFRFDPSDVVESHGSPGGSFVVHFTRQGPNAVPSADAEGDGVPDFVQEVEAIYDEVLAVYTGEMGFRAPVSDEGVADNGGDGRFDVYLIDFGGIADGAFQLDTDGCAAGNGEVCAGYMVQENDYAGYGYPSVTIANRILGSHELFHAVQAAYDTGQGSVFGEGTAVWATERFDGSLEDFEWLIDGYLATPERALDVPPPGPVSPFSYGAAIYFQFLEERYGEGSVEALWRRAENGAFGVEDPVWFEELGPLIVERGGVSFAESFVEFATWNLFTGGFADATRSYAGGDGYARVAIEAAAAPFSLRLRSFHASAQYYRAPRDGRAEMTAALVPTADVADDLEGLTLLLVPEQGGAYGEVTRVGDPAAGEERVDTSGAEALVVVVVNGRQGGDSRRPTLCIGSPEEVAACAADAGGAG